MPQHTFRVSDIHCGACEAAIAKSLSRLDGVAAVRPDAASNQVEVTYRDGETDPARIAERLADAGYPVVP